MRQQPSRATRLRSISSPAMSLLLPTVVSESRRLSQSAGQSPDGPGELKRKRCQDESNSPPPPSKAPHMGDGIDSLLALRIRRHEFPVAPRRLSDGERKGG